MDKAVIIKIISLILIAVVFFYFAIVVDQRQLALFRLKGGIDYECWVIYGGFLLIYIAYIIAVIKKEEPDKNLNAIWAFFGVGAYLAIGIYMIDYVEANKTPSFSAGPVRVSSENDNTPITVTGVLCLLVTVILFFDGWVAAGGDICGK